MPYVKISFGSSRNITVNDVDYIEIDASDLDDNGKLSQQDSTEYWQDAVNDYLADTDVEVVENYGD